MLFPISAQQLSWAHRGTQIVNHDGSDDVRSGDNIALMMAFVRLDLGNIEQ
jgi:hypothetical protein